MNSLRISLCTGFRKKRVATDASLVRALCVCVCCVFCLCLRACALCVLVLLCVRMYAWVCIDCIVYVYECELGKKGEYWPMLGKRRKIKRVIYKSQVFQMFDTIHRGQDLTSCHSDLFIVPLLLFTCADNFNFIHCTHFVY